MSKIIQALEKAKKEGGLQQTAGAVDERETLGPLVSAPETAAPAQPVRERKRRSRRRPVLVTAKALDPEVLRAADPHLDALHRPMSVAAEQYRALRQRLEGLSAEAGMRTIAITSAAKGEGKSLTAVNLAATLAQDATRHILLVDADLRRPHVHELLGLGLSPGLGEYLQGTVPREAVIRETPFFGLCVATAGAVQGHPAELLASPEWEEFIARSRAEFDYVIVDTPPLHPVSDVPFLAASVDGVLVVVRAGKTSKSLLKQTLETLPPGKVLGTVLNRVESLTGRFGYGSNYGPAGYYYGYS
ncbi:MAG: CpsD/CapB family tyrosine-protein kinase [Thermodesulfobacteriota bacterium]